MAVLKRNVLNAFITRCVQEAAANDASDRATSDIRLLRRHKRTPINVRALFHAGIASKSTVITDISKGGLGLSPANGLYPGCEVTIALITGETTTGIVRWWLAGSCGVQLHKPFHDNDVFENAVRRKASAAKAATSLFNGFPLPSGTDGNVGTERDGT